MVWTGDGHNGEGNGTMTNKYASNCTTCQTRVVAGAGILSKVATGWNVSCGQHATTASAVKVVIVNTEAVAAAMQELAEAREAYDAGCIALHATFQIVMALRTSKDSDAKTVAHEAHALNTNLVMAARKRAGRAASTLENLRAGR